MKSHLALHYKGINHKYHRDLWQKALVALGWQSVALKDADFTIMWGPNPELTESIQHNKPVLVIDFPYWNRGFKRRDGTEYYKISLNGQHPTPYVMNEIHTPERYISTRGPIINPWRSDGGGEYILIAGMGQKASNQFGYQQVGDWEKRASEIIRTHTSLPIHYRPKPRQRPAPAISGTIFDDGKQPIEEVVSKATAVVCHHGNPAVHALAAGVPIFMNGPIGAASHFASFDLHKINEPIYPEGREQFFYNLSHWQWSVQEIISGKVLMSYKERGFLK